jgi:hypothetical protein
MPVFTYSAPGGSGQTAVFNMRLAAGSSVTGLNSRDQS